VCIDEPAPPQSHLQGQSKAATATAVPSGKRRAQAADRHKSSTGSRGRWCACS
jgi:hypothetical protein